MKKIKKLNINLFPESTSEEEYNRKKAQFISEYEVYKSSFLFGGFEKDPVLGEAKWNEYFPNGYQEWRNNQRKLNALGQQNVVDKINEIIDILNK
jgi:hypothetical protein